MTSNELQTRRRQATWRRRRIIYNNDGCDAIGYQLDADSQATPETFWSQRCNGMEAKDVDSIFYCSTISFNLHTHDSKVAELYDRPALVPTKRNFAADWIAGGRDGLQLTIDFCRKHDIEVVWSQRMNDVHDNWYPVFYPEFKKQHPELLIFQEGDVDAVRSNSDWTQPYLYATAVDYGREEIRDRQLAMIEDVCRRYDIDGIELDFLRNPIYFRPTLECRPCEQEHLDVMSGFMRRVREMTEAVGRERGKPLLITCRVPNQVDCCCKIGLDIERWLADDLIDIVVSSLENDPFTGPLAELVELGHRHDKPVYAGVAEKGPPVMSGLEMTDIWAGIATHAWNAGVDGLYIFNADPMSPEWSAIGDPDRLAPMDKVFAVDNLSDRGKEHVYPQTGRLPVELALSQPLALTLPVGDDVNARELRELSLLIYVDNLTHMDEIEFQINGTSVAVDVVYHTDGVSPAQPSNFFLFAQPDPSLLRQGDNAFTALLKKRCDTVEGRPIISELALVVKYKR